MMFILEQWLDLLATRDPTPAGGSLALATLGGAAALAAKCARLSGEPPEPFASSAADFALYAAEDCDDYTALTSDDSARIDEALANGFRHARAALAFLEEATGLANSCTPALLPDLRAACSLAETATTVLLDNLSINLERLAKNGLNIDPHAVHITALRERLSALPTQSSFPLKTSP